jgi:hypothetical protein
MRKHIIVLAAVLAALGTAATAVAAPATKQNGTAPAFAKFTSICAVTNPDESNYGECNGDTTAFTNVTGKVNAVQAKPGIYNLGISFSGLVAGESYKLWGYHSSNPSDYFLIGTGTADASGALQFSYQYTASAGDKIAFDLNHLQVGNDNGGYGYTIVTSFFSDQLLTVDPVTGLLL